MTTTRPTAPPAPAGPRRPQPRPETVPADAAVEVAMTVNGTEVSVRVPTRAHLADVLREQLGLTGTHLGCEHGVCGMCTVLVDGDAVRSCLLFALQCEGADVVTVEGLGAADDQHPLQQAFSAHHGLQCGFCTPGMLMSGYDLLVNGPHGTAIEPGELPEQMSGVLCRCTGYRGIIAAVADVAAEYPEGLPGPRNCAARTLVGRGGAHPGDTGTRTGAPGSGPTLPAEVRVPTGAPSATVSVRSTLSSPPADVWAVLEDFDLLAACLPGAELVEVLDGDRYRGRAGIALGPVKLSFEGLAQVIEREPARRHLRLLAQGADAGGSATQADIRLRVDTDGADTVLVAEAALFLSGRIAQFGRALAGDVSRRLFEQFATAVDEVARTGAPATVAAGPSPVRLAAGAARDAFGRAVARLGTALRARWRARRRR